MTYQLHITPSVGKRWTYVLEKPLVKIGRANHCEVVVNDQLVSREHCLLQLRSEGLFLEDLNSVNGTLLNGKRITRVLLHPGDKIRLGLSDILLEELREKETASPPQPAKPKEPPPRLSKEFESKGPKEPKPEQVQKPEPLGPEKSKPGRAHEPKQSGKSEAAVPRGPDPRLISMISKNQEPPTILVIHPDCSQIEYLLQPLAASGVVIHRAADTSQVQSVLKKSSPDSILLCSHIEENLNICQEIKSHPQAGPIVLLIQEEPWGDAVSLLEAGADEVLRQPDPTELQVRLRIMLELHRLRKETTLLTSQMEKRVSEDVSEAERINRLKRYLSPQVVAAVLSGDESHVLKPTRQEVSIVFSDLRNFTHFSETSEPEEIIAMLSDFHALYGEIIFQYDGTLERFAGDGVMVFFGAPVRFKDHASRAVAMAVAARERLVDLRNKWKKLGYSLDISFGISTGYVFVGNIGFEGRMDYAAIGKTTNLAARLCAAAKGGEILISRKTLFQVEDLVEVEETGALEVKGFSEPVMAYNVLHLKAPFTPTPVD
ncbi:MAG: FHA domain-containing protein [Deltaproteobacteria bacterium]|nr:FHA domain-containing protein [Deltaproteobacteria bacterium]